MNKFIALNFKNDNSQIAIRLTNILVCKQYNDEAEGDYTSVYFYDSDRKIRNIKVHQTLSKISAQLNIHNIDNILVHIVNGNSPILLVSQYISTVQELSKGSAITLIEPQLKIIIVNEKISMIMDKL